MSTSKKIVLCMIVKNEAHVIERCLASTLPVIDTYCIVDTGSTDGTQEKIKKFFDQLGIEGQVHDRPWVSFGHNRTEALELARPLGDYSLMIDADEILEFAGDFDPEKFKAQLDKDMYGVFAKYGATKYHRPQFTSNNKRFYYRGVCHEYVACHDKDTTHGFINGFINRPIQDGARSKDPEKYKKDAKLFEDALASGTTDPADINRYHFYMAQSYRDSGQFEKAIEAYQKRADLGGWNEEVFYSLFQVGKIKEHLGKYTLDEIVKHYVDAYNVAPFRAETLWSAAKLCQSYGRYDQAWRLIKQAVKLPLPEGALFVIEFIYEWAALDTFASLAYWVEEYELCLKAINSLLNNPKVPTQERDRLEKNKQLVTQHILGR